MTKIELYHTNLPPSPLMMSKILLFRSTLTIQYTAITPLLNTTPFFPPPKPWGAAAGSQLHHKRSLTTLKVGLTLCHLVEIP